MLCWLSLHRRGLLGGRSEDRDIGAGYLGGSHGGEIRAFWRFVLGGRVWKIVWAWGRPLIWWISWVLAFLFLKRLHRSISSISICGQQMAVMLVLLRELRMRPMRGLSLACLAQAFL